MRESVGYPFLIQYICKEVFDACHGLHQSLDRAGDKLSVAAQVLDQQGPVDAHIEIEDAGGEAPASPMKPTGR
jgi:hypothetical protein